MDNDAVAVLLVYSPCSLVRLRCRIGDAVICIYIQSRRTDFRCTLKKSVFLESTVPFGYRHVVNNTYFDNVLTKYMTKNRTYKRKDSRSVSDTISFS